MALNFPDSPTIGDVYSDPTSGFSYEWDGTVWQSFSSSSLGQIKILDDISGSFNGSTQTFALTSSTNAVTPANAQQIRVVLGGVVQDPSDDYTVSGSNITFTTPPVGGLSFSGIIFGTAVPINTVSDGSVSPSKLSTGGPSWNTSGDVYISGITTITNASGTVTVGVGTTALLVEGNARITGILTVGSSSITLDGSTNEIKIGSGVTISSTGITGSASTVTSAAVAYGLEGSPDIVVGSVTGTSASFSGNVSVGGTLTYDDVTNIDSVGLITARSGIQVLAGGIDAVGVVTATSFVGDITGNVTGDATGLSGTPNLNVGVVTATSFSGELVGAAVTTSASGLQATNVDLSGFLREQCNVTAGKLSNNTNIDLENGMVHLFTTTETTTSTPNIRYNASTSLNSIMNVGEAISVTIVTTAAAAAYSAQLTIDGGAVTENWTGGSAPTAGGTSGVDIYTYTIMKTASATFTVIASQTKTS